MPHIIKEVDAPRDMVMQAVGLAGLRREADDRRRGPSQDRIAGMTRRWKGRVPADNIGKRYKRKWGSQ
ncbi:MAG: hypothetical protein N2C12_08585, partial [Planctomycetales bacterium]